MDFKLLLLCWICINDVNTAEHAEEVFIVGHNTCITNSSSAIVFNLPINNVNTWENTVSIYYPPVPTAAVDCNFNEQETCSKDWTRGHWRIVNSLDKLIEGGVTDRRWEAFNAMKNIPHFTDMEPIHEFKNSENFTIPLWIRSGGEVNIFLCSDKSGPMKSNCYIIMVSENLKHSGFRKCGLGSIDSNGDPREREGNGLCKKIRGDKQNVGVKMDIWNNFKIIRRNERLCVTKDENVYLKFNDTSEPFSSKYMYIYSARPSLWKTENYNFLYTDQSFNDLIGPQIETFNNTICISMFIVTCNFCTLEISLMLKKQGGSKSREMYSYPFKTVDEHWQEVTIKKENVHGTWIMKMKTKASKKKSGEFWAIDDFRRCSPQQEYRYLQTSEPNAPCQKIENQELIRVKTTNLSNKAVQCPEDTFGNLCVPCKILPGVPKNTYCTKFKYCEHFENSLQCYCTAGYGGLECEDRCLDKRYGHNCQNKCSEFCSEECNNVNGFCSGKCKNGFVGAKCDDPPVPTFKYPPTVIEENYDFCKIKIDTTIDQRGSHSKDKITQIYLQYKEDTSHLEYKSFNVKKNQLEHTITSLSADTRYKIRAILNDASLTHDYIPTATCHTKCEKVNLNDVKIVPFTTNVSINTGYNPSRSCKIGNYSYILKNSSGDVIDGHIIDGKFHIKNLRPFTVYYVEFLYNRIPMDLDPKHFSTLEGVPSVVREVNPRSSDKNIVLNWREPAVKNGNVFYIIRYKHRQGLACQNSEDSSETQIDTRSNATFINLTDLKPFSTYQVQIIAATSAGYSDPITASVNTAAQEALSTDELVWINNFTTSSTSISTALNRIVCHDIKGPIWVKLTACDEKTCKSFNPQKFNYWDTELKINSLSPYVVYNVTLEVSRNCKTWKSTNSTFISTKSTLPHKVTEGIITSKDDASVSLRWLPPHPPTGRLETYFIGYNCTNRKNGEVNISVDNRCCDWTEFRCGKITGLRQNAICDIKIYAKNKDHPDLSEFFIGKVNISYDKPLPPYNLSVTWFVDNSFEISWKRPNNTNGNLKKIDIIVNGESVGEMAINPINECNLTYQYTVEQSKLSTNIKWCKTNTISILLKNQGGYSNSASFTDLSPPPIPEVHVKETVRTPQTIALELKGIQKLFIDYLYLLVTKISDFSENQLIDFESSVQTQNESEHYLKNNIRCKIDLQKYNLRTYRFEIGNINGSCKNYKNSPLEPNTNYTISMIFVVACPNNKTLLRTKRKTLEARTPTFDEYIASTRSSNTGLYALILLLLIPAAILVFYLRKKNGTNKSTAHYLQFLNQIPCCLQKSNEEIDVTPLAAIRPKAKIKPIVKPRKSIQIHHIKTANSKLVKLTELEAYVKKAIESGELERQHNLFPKGMLKPCEVGSLPENKAKNRYKNLIAYDHSRVLLEKLNGDEHSDYINANYIDGYKMARAYIATQGPKQCTLHDFWRMIWQENVVNIIMLANIIENGKKKVEQYWPDMHQEKVCGNLRIRQLSQNVYANFEQREFEVLYQNESRKISQFHFTTWPDHGVPLYSQSMIVFLQNLLRIPYSADSPILVHCSAGVGRTGTVILSDICLRMAAGEGAVDFLGHLEHLRNQRSNLVDNIEQYKLSHLVVIECLFGMRTAIACNDELPSIIERILKSNGIKAEMNHIEETQWQDSAMETMLETEETPLLCPEKNRFAGIEATHYRVFLTCHPPHDASSSYINAVQVDGFRNPGKYIVTQQPMPNTVGDFWRMIVERRITVILSMNKINPRDKTICQFWPEVGYDMSPVSFIKLETVQEKSISNCCKIITVHIELRGVKVLKLEIVCMNDWQANVLLPSSIQNFLSFVEEAETKSRNYQPVVVTCYDGATACGLYIAMTFIIEKMKLEHECDVCQAVRSIRHNRRQFVSSKEQYEFLYRASVTYYGGYQSYSNFN